jgi:uncharacterized protein (DUF1697 family)
MTRYVAFLRGINVGGHVARMDALRHSFESVGLTNVSTYRGSGNVRIETTEEDFGSVRDRIHKQLRSTLGYDVEALVRSTEEIQALVELQPFREPPPAPAIPYVSFVSRELPKRVPLPVLSPKRDVRTFRTQGPDVFSWALPTGDGHFGFPNLFVEKLFGLPATTRNWSTVTGVFPASKVPADSPRRPKSSPRARALRRREPAASRGLEMEVSPRSASRRDHLRLRS